MPQSLPGRFSLDWSCLDFSLPHHIEIPELIIHDSKVLWCSAVVRPGYCASDTCFLSPTPVSARGGGDVLLICPLVDLTNQNGVASLNHLGSPAAYKVVRFPSSIRKVQNWNSFSSFIVHLYQSHSGTQIPFYRISFLSDSGLRLEDERVGGMSVTTWNKAGLLSTVIHKCPSLISSSCHRKFAETLEGQIPE